MSVNALMFENDGSVAESGEEAYRRILARKLRERGCPRGEVQSSVERLLAKDVGFRLVLDAGQRPDGAA